MYEKIVAPSLICMDLCNVQAEVESVEKLGCKMLHLDIIDGRFSPDMPLGINMIKQLRSKTNMIFDAHLMSADNEPYVELLLESGIDRLCFHPEFESRPGILLRKIKNAGCKPGLAISPETPISQIKYLLPLCEFVLIMRIDPGYAHLPGTQSYPHVDEKLRILRDYIKEHGMELEVEVDGRVGFDEIPYLAELGVSTFVSGSKGVFYSGNTREENWKKLEEIIGGLDEGCIRKQ